MGKSERKTRDQKMCPGLPKGTKTLHTPEYRPNEDISQAVQASLNFRARVATITPMRGRHADPMTQTGKKKKN